MSFDAIATWFVGLGIHPVLGGFVAGLLAGLFVRGRVTATIEGTGFVDSGLANQATRASSLFRKSTVTLEQHGTSLSLDGRAVPITPQTMSDVVAKVRGGEKIEAIKLVRTETGLGLAEAKLLVETIAKSPLAT